jgi:hypothetical protein
MNYRIAFDASQNGSQLVIWALLPMFAMFFGMIGWVIKTSGDPIAAAKGKLFMLISGAGLLISLMFFAAKYSEYRVAKRALEQREYVVVEGTVRGFVPMPPGGHSTESFKVGDVSFEYGAGWGSIVFNSEWNRGFIHDGTQVRISSRAGNILRIETK